MDQNSIRAMIVFSDTHLGLAPWKLGIFQNTVTDRSSIVHQFVRWLLDLEITTAEEVLVGNELDQICRKKLLLPDELVLNGNILELWDASDRAVDLSSQSIFQDLMQLRCRKLYLAGNHDFAIQQVKRCYPWGNSDLNILPDTYPNMKGDDIETVKVGENHYLILHGHQLSKTFRIAPWQIVSKNRNKSLRQDMEACHQVLTSQLQSLVVSAGRHFGNLSLRSSTIMVGANLSSKIRMLLLWSTIKYNKIIKTFIVAIGEDYKQTIYERMKSESYISILNELSQLMYSIVAT
jgi:UDP-2,3-diacylglucosamine pyrophosphatase LpxH